tara:strand:+ start:404 stop:2872 length:2469 start_codon:yes stop_codon:yes gene_type:complete
MKGTTQFNDFKDLKDALAEVRKNNPPAETQYQKQAKKMGYDKDPKLVVSEQAIVEKNLMPAIQKIVDTKGAAKVGGVMLDMFTASVLTQAYAKVSDANKKKMETSNITTLVKLAQRVMGLKASNEFGKDPLKGFPYNEVKESIMSESAMSDMLIDIQQGATAKELSKTWKIPMSMAKDFLKSYYGQKKGPRKEDVQEGTWQTPKNKGELKKLMDLVSKPVFATKPSDIDKYMKQMPFGDDELYDDLESLFYPKDSDGKIIYPIKRMKKFPKTDLNQVAMDSLNGRWLTAKKQGNGWDITHINFDFDEVEEAMKRKSGSLRPKRRMKLDMSHDMSEDEMSRAKEVIALQKKHDQEKETEKDKLEKEKENAKKSADRAKQTESFVTKSPFKLKSKQYPRAIATETQGFGKRHANQENILEACDSFGMITEQELQLEKIERVLGKQGFLTYNKTELNDIFEDRETQRMILALESVTEERKPTEYDRETITRALEEDLNVEFTKPDGMKAVGPVLKMSSNTYNLKDMHTGKSYTYKYINEDISVKTFGEVISEARYSAKLVKQAGGIAFDKRYVAGNMTGAINAIEKLKKGLSDDPKVRELLRIANESFNTPFFKEMNSEEQDAYVKFFQSALKKFNVTSPAQLSTDKKKEFFNYIDKNYKAKNEVEESVDEGKYTAYSDLLLMKARIIAKEGPKSDKLPAVDSQIRIVMKRLGVKENNIPHMCATHVEHAMWGSGVCISGDHDLIEQEDGSFEVNHYTVEFAHGIEEMVSIQELGITKQESHAHAMAKKAGRKKLKANKSEQSKIDARRKTFREKMKKLGYIKAR